MKKVILFFMFMVIFSACSSLNPFKKNNLQDYNALTYGEDYKERGGDWAPQKLRVGSDDHFAQSAYSKTRDGSQRGVASVKNAYEDEKESTLDPTSDRVRQSVEVARGQAVADYKRGDRATKSDFWDEAPNDGSLWSNELDANYFFTKGKTRGMGDIISIKAEDAFVKQVAEEIKKSLTPAEQEVEMALYMKNGAAGTVGKDGAKDAAKEAYRSLASEDLQSSDAQDANDKMQKTVRWSQVDLTKAIGLAPNEEFRAEVVDKFPNGNFKVRAIKRILYRGSSKLVSLVGVAPSADFDEKDAIASGKLYEYKIKVAR